MEVGIAHRSVEVQHTRPNVGFARVGEIGLWQVEYAVTLLHEACLSCDGTACHVAGVGVIFDAGCLGRVFAACRSLHPCRHIEGEDIWFCTILDCHLIVAIVTHNDVLTVERTADGATVSHLLASSHDEWRWSHSDVLQFAKVITHMRRLVVATHLPYHRVAILMVVPQGVVAVFRRSRCGIDADAVVGSAHDDFLTPVAKDVALIARGSLRVVVGHRT